MSRAIITESLLTNLANLARTASGTSQSYTPAQIYNALSQSSGGGGIAVEEMSVGDTGTIMGPFITCTFNEADQTYSFSGLTSLIQPEDVYAIYIDFNSLEGFLAYSDDLDYSLGNSYWTCTFSTNLGSIDFRCEFDNITSLLYASSTGTDIVVGDGIMFVLLTIPVN